MCPRPSETPGALGLVSCWLLAQHPPWHPACPSGQPPGSVHLGGSGGGWGWWNSGFPEGGEEEVLGLAPQLGVVVKLPEDPGGTGYPLPPPPPLVGFGGSACYMAASPLLGSRCSFLRGSPSPLPAEPQKNIRCICSKPGDGVFGAASVQCYRAPLVSRPPPPPPPLSGVHPHFLLVQVPV